MKNKIVVFFNLPDPSVSVVKYFYYEIFFALIYFSNLIIASVSNYNYQYLLLKTLSSFTLFISYFLIQKFIYKNNFKFSTLIFSKFSIILYIFFIVSLASLFNGNFNFLGLRKFYLISVQLLPLIIITKLALVSRRKERTFAFIFVIMLIGIAASLSSFALEPFNPFAVYSFSFSRWSHVVFGRFIIIPLMVTLYFLYTGSDKKKIILNYLLTLLFCFTLISSGFRAGIIALFAFLISLIIYTFVNSKSKVINPRSLLIFSFFLLLPLFVLFSQPKNLVDRVSGMEQIVSGSNVEDGTITSRFSAYKIAWNGGWDKPLFGNGLGSFMFASGSFTKQMKYPHNIFLEFFYEMGLIGVGLFILLLILILISVKKYGFWLLSLYLIFLWFSLFSKDIPSNALLFTGLAFIGTSQALITKQQQTKFQ